MSSVVLDNLNPTILEQLKGMAQAHNRSLEDEIKAILEQVTKVEVEEKKAKAQEAWAKVDAARQRHGNKVFSDSAELLREDRRFSKRGIFRERLKEARKRHGNQVFSDSVELVREDRNC